MPTITLRLGDSFEIIATLEGVGAVVCDPPYLISFMGKTWDSEGEGGENAEWHRKWLEACFGALPPGGIIKVFSATRTFHRLAAAMEAVGFLLHSEHSLEAWAYGSGFPKYLNTSKAVDAHLGKSAERPVIGKGEAGAAFHYGNPGSGGFGTLAALDQGTPSSEWDVTGAATEEAAKFNGWATALKPGWEPFIVGIKP